MAIDFGLDLSCTYRTQALEQVDGSFFTSSQIDLALDMAEVTGRACLTEAVIRRQTTPRGTLPDVEIPTTTGNYGYDVTGFVNADVGARGLGMLAAGIDGELTKDERVVRSQTTATMAGPVLILTEQITSGDGPFPLVLAISQVTVQVLSGG